MARGSRRLAALGCLLAWGCSTMRELPRDQYAAKPERSNVRIETEAGAKHEFERIQVTADSLTGLSPRPSEGNFNGYDATSMRLADVRKMSARMIDWYRTGLILGVGVAAAIGLEWRQGGTGTEGDRLERLAGLDPEVEGWIGGAELGRAPLAPL